MKRLLIILLSAAAAVLLTALEEGVLAPVLEARLWKYSSQLAVLIVCLPVLILIAASGKLRKEFQVHFGWTWLILLPLSFLVVNVVLLKKPPGASFGLPQLTLVLAGLGTGLKEELFLRGFAFARGGETSPRYTVLLSSVVFGLLHCLNLLAGYNPEQIIGYVLSATVIGITFGLIRIATGSIAWGVLIHGAINATKPFCDDTSPISKVVGPLILVTLVISVVMVFTHPKMKPNKQIDGDS